MVRRGAWGYLLAGLISSISLAAGCKSTLNAFVCDSDEDCQGSDRVGRCEDTKFCSVPDLQCSSERRYGDSAGENSNQCVAANDDTDAGIGDAAVDAGGCWGVGFSILNIGECVSVPNSDVLSQGIELDSPGIYSLNTTTGTFSTPDNVSLETSYTTVQQSDGSDLFVLAAESFFLSGDSTLFITGDKPVAIVAMLDIEIEGEIYAGGFSNQDGAGGGQNCEEGAGHDGRTSSRGGGGGSFGTVGGIGAPVEGTASSPGIIVGNEALVPLRGGCRGGSGGTADGLNTAEGGSTGGAIELVAGGAISVLGTIVVSGGGGSGGSGDSPFGAAGSGGGGGGSGGAILLQSRAIELLGLDRLNINGGGGGGGSSGGISPGSTGSDGGGVAPSSKAGVAGGPGGQAVLVGDGGNGGKGSTSARDAEAGREGTLAGSSAGGGGGGGGGLGRISVVEMP